MFQLAAEETGSLRSQSGAFKTGRGKHRKYAPYGFTEQGVAMLSSVLNSDRAVQVNIEIMRAFVRLRESVSKHKDLAGKLTELENRYDRQEGTQANGPLPTHWRPSQTGHDRSWRHAKSRS
jgi:hypothetical protein